MRSRCSFSAVLAPARQPRATLSHHVLFDDAPPLLHPASWMNSYHPATNVYEATCDAMAAELLLSSRHTRFLLLLRSPIYIFFDVCAHIQHVLCVVMSVCVCAFAWVADVWLAWRCRCGCLPLACRLLSPHTACCGPPSTLDHPGRLELWLACAPAPWLSLAQPACTIYDCTRTRCRLSSIYFPLFFLFLSL